MNKFEPGDRVVVNMKASDSYWGMMGTISSVGPEDAYRVDMDFVPDKTRRLSLADYKGWNFSEHMLDKIESDTPQLRNTLALLSEWEDVVESVYGSANKLDRLGYGESAKSVRSKGDSLLRLSSALRAALKDDGIEIPDQTGS